MEIRLVLDSADALGVFRQEHDRTRVEFENLERRVERRLEHRLGGGVAAREQSRKPMQHPEFLHAVLQFEHVIDHLGGRRAHRARYRGDVPRGGEFRPRENVDRADDLAVRLDRDGERVLGHRPGLMLVEDGPREHFVAGRDTEPSLISELHLDAAHLRERGADGRQRAVGEEVADRERGAGLLHAGLRVAGD